MFRSVTDFITNAITVSNISQNKANINDAYFIRRLKKLNKFRQIVIREVVNTLLLSSCFKKRRQILTFKLDIIIKAITHLLQHRHGLINITKQSGRTSCRTGVGPTSILSRRDVSSRYAQRRPRFYACLHTECKTGRSVRREKKIGLRCGVTRYEFPRGAQIPLSASGRGNGSNVFDEYTDLDKRPRRLNYV